MSSQSNSPVFRSLLSCKLPSGNWSQCDSPSYRKYLVRLSSHHSKITLDQLWLPASSRVLFYGFSFLRQIADEMYCADSSASWRLLDRKQSACAGGSVERYAGNRIKRICPLFSPSRWRSARRNATAILVSNDASLQHSSSLASRLPAFLSRYGPFDYIVFERPHDDCFFTYQKHKASRHVNYSQYACVDLEEQGASSLRKRDRDKRIWEMMRKAARVRAYEFGSWGHNNQQQASPKSKQHSGGSSTTNGERHAHAATIESAKRPPVVPFAAPDSFVDAEALIHSQPCSLLECGKRVASHQCRGSAISLVARKVAIQMRNAHHAAHVG